MRIRSRLTLYGAAVVAGAILVFGIVLIWLAQNTVPEEQVSNLALVADETVVEFQGAAPSDLMPESPAVTVNVAESTEPFVVVVGEDGRVLYSTAQLDGTPPSMPAALILEAVQTGQSQAEAELNPGVVAQLVARSWETNSETGIVVAGQSTAFIEQQVEGLRGLVFVAVLITLFVSVAAGWIVAGRALRPLKELAETTDAIGSTADLSNRLPPVDAKDEVGVLTSSFNSMLERLQKTRAELAASLETQQQFVADASHELRTPLTTIRNNAGFLAERPDAAPDDRQAAISEIREEADRMARLVDDLLALARSDAGLVAEMAPVELTDIARQAAGRSEDVTVQFDRPVESRGDADALRRVLVILINNGLRHGRPPVDVGIRVNSGTAEIAVRDHGPGLADQELERVFDRFYQTDPSRNPEGAGLGLAIARQIADEHGGTLVAGNHPGGGAVFTLKLPL